MCLFSNNRSNKRDNAENYNSASAAVWSAVEYKAPQKLMRDEIVTGLEAAIDSLARPPFGNEVLAISYGYMHKDVAENPNDRSSTLKTLIRDNPLRLE